MTFKILIGAAKYFLSEKDRESKQGKCEAKWRIQERQLSDPVYWIVIFASVKSEACVDADDSVEAGLSPFPFHGVKIENKVTGERDWCRFILAWVSGLIWSEVKQLWDVGLEEYVHDMWNVIDFVTNSLYVATVALRVVAYYRVQKENEGQLPGAPVIELQREQWDTWDPMLISEGLFSAANIFR